MGFFNRQGWGRTLLLAAAIMAVLMGCGGEDNTDSNETQQPAEYTLQISIYPIDGGTVSRNPDKSAYNAGEQVTVRAVPASGYRFVSWSGVSTSTNVEVIVTMDANLTLTADFQRVDGPITPPDTAAKKTYTITFNANGGSGAPASVTTGTDGKLASLPTTVPTRSGYTFNGWYTASTGGTKIEAGQTFTANTTVYAQWTTNTQSTTTYTITFNANGGSGAPASITTGTDGKLANLPTTVPTRSGYTFNGWYTTSTGGTKIEAGQTFTANTIVYAQWTLITYNITYDLAGGNDGVPANPRSYNVEMLPITLSNPTRGGYTFDGWTGSNGTAKEKNVTIPVGSTGSKNYVANWTQTSGGVDGGGTVDPSTVVKGTVTDTDGKTYKTVKIGGLTWMAENLNKTTANSWCYNDSPDSCAKYGRLYTWAAANRACLNGWHLPTHDEWDNLVTAVGGSSVAGKKLISTSYGYYWTDDYGFSALLGGYRYFDGYFTKAGYNGYWWTATEFSGDRSGASAYSRGMGSGDDVTDDVYFDGKSYGFSVRCVKD